MLVSEIGIYKNHQHVEHVALVQDSLGKEWLMDCLLLNEFQWQNFLLGKLSLLAFMKRSICSP